ncbi:MAG: sulfatase [Microbacteriaceae bacterium]|nr:sulfatase [Microbacteriaceae bacterium]
MIRRRLTLVLALVLLVALPLVPGVIAAGSPSALFRLPVESLIAVLVLVVLPWRVARIAVGVVLGLIVAVGVLLAGLDAAFEYALNTHFDPNDVQQVGDGFGVVRDSIGTPVAVALLVLIALLLVAVVLGLAWASQRVADAVRRHPVRGSVVASAVTATWVIAALVGSQFVAGEPAAASASLGSIAAAASRASATLGAQAALSRKVASDPYASVPSSDLLTKLRGKDVVVAFIESYGQVAVQNTGFSDGVDQVLRAGGTQLAADGYTSQSAWLTSPTFGGVSWLAHSTLQTGLWVDSQSTYDKVTQTDRFTLSDAFRKAGWKTVSDVPSDTHPWAVGSSFYHYDTLLDSNNVGYHGPAFGYARIPDQYTWQHFYDSQLAGAHKPVMAEIDFVSSHTPWAPLPQLVPWSQIGDGSVYAPQPAEGQSTDVVWQDPKKVQQAYGQSVQYSLGAMFSFLHTFDDPNLVLVVLGDHQPATIVSGKGANHQVPISIISKDPGVFQSIADWKWQDGVFPTAKAPLWRMDRFRDSFLGTFGAR